MMVACRTSRVTCHKSHVTHATWSCEYPSVPIEKLRLVDGGEGGGGGGGVDVIREKKGWGGGLGHLRDDRGRRT